jgi:predicted HAD superfamily Cof-like phosphohydrolase
MEKQLLQVLDFQNAFGISSPDKPKMLSKKRATLRQKLLEEEVGELREAKNTIEVADALIDILYITCGTLHEYGLGDRAVMLFDEVHRSNMSKVGSDGKAIFRADGKVMKPETYSEPKLQPIIERDFSLYKENEILKELAAISKQETEDVIVAKIKSKLKLFDKFLFWLDIKIENRLKKKIEVKFPVTVDGRVIVKVYDEEYAV